MAAEVIKIESSKIRCDNCIFSFWIIGIGRPMLVCKQKVNFVGKYRSVPLAGSCPNFYPSSILRAGAKAKRRIPLTRGKFAIVEQQDYYQLSEFRWQAMPCFRTVYAARKSAGKTVKMHRKIMEPRPHLVVDHIDHDGLNNCRSNLRLSSLTQNNCNAVSRRGTSKYKGVHWKKNNKKWVAKIQLNGKSYHIGCFTDEIAAARAYDEKAKVLHGEFACLNFPPSAERKIKNQNVNLCPR